jgi:pimeloyl-ACP methyl ester carboxylesterase
MDTMLDQLSQLVYDVSKSAGGQQVSIIGWSLGGIYAREIAKVSPDVVRQVITLGTPFKGGPGTNADFLYELLTKDLSHKDPNVLKRIAEPPPVPFTSIYSKTDGVVDWESSLEKVGPHSENIEIPGACHLGLGHNPISMYVIANRLTQTRDNWSPYR